MSTRRTFNPKKIKRVRNVGFRKRSASHSGRQVLKRRHLKGRH